MGAYVNYSNRLEFVNKKWNNLMNQYTFDEINETLINEIIHSQHIKIVQISDYFPKDKLPLIYSLFEKRPDITFRMYHFLEDNICDLSFLTQLKSIKKLSIDYIGNISHVEVIKELSLTSLHLYVFQLKDYDFIKSLSVTLESLSIYTEVKGKVNFDIQWLLKYQSLKELYLGKLSIGIENVQYMKNLKKLTLRGIKLENLDFLKNSNVTHLSIHWCSMNDLSSLKDNSQLEYLELWRVLKLEDVSFISTLTNLKTLKLQDLANIQNFPPINHCLQLNEIHLDNLKSLEDIHEISASKTLSTLTIIGSQKLTIEDYIRIFQTTNIESIDLKGVGNKKKAKAIEDLMVKYHKIKK